jgi:hypothetical protein
VGLGICAPQARFECYAPTETIFTSHSKLEFIYSVEAQHKIQLINIFQVQLQIYNVNFLALTDENPSITSLKLMGFAISYSLLEGLSREMIWPSVLRL